MSWQSRYTQKAVGAVGAVSSAAAAARLAPLEKCFRAEEPRDELEDCFRSRIFLFGLILLFFIDELRTGSIELYQSELISLLSLPENQTWQTASRNIWDEKG
jgi:hypothetical protein